MKYRIVLVIVLCLFITTNVGATEPEYLTNANKFLKEKMELNNAISQEQYGINVFHNIFLTKDGTMVMDLNEAGFQRIPYTKEAQLDEMIDGILTDRAELRNAGVFKIRVFIEGVFFKDYDL